MQKKKNATTEKERTKLGKTQRTEGKVKDREREERREREGEGRRKKRRKQMWLSLRKQSLLSETEVPPIELKDCLV